VPLLDADGSTIALVDAATPDSGPATTLVYDPSGATYDASGRMVSCAANSWPFLYQGLEHESYPYGGSLMPIDPAQLDYSGGGQYYNPQIQRGLSETGATGIGGAATGPGPSAAGGSLGGGGGGGGSFFNPTQMATNVAVNLAGPEAAKLATWAASKYLGVNLAVQLVPAMDTAPVPVLDIAIDIYEIVNLFEDLFGGSSTPQLPRKLQHGPNRLYPEVTAIDSDLTPNEESSFNFRVVIDLPNGDPPQRAVAKKPMFSGCPAYTGEANVSGLLTDIRSCFAPILSAARVTGATGLCAVTASACTKTGEPQVCMAAAASCGGLGVAALVCVNRAFEKECGAPLDY
jgi:hypothetical protein